MRPLPLDSKIPSVSSRPRLPTGRGSHHGLCEPDPLRLGCTRSKPLDAVSTCSRPRNRRLKAIIEHEPSLLPLGRTEIGSKEIESLSVVDRARGLALRYNRHNAQDYKEDDTWFRIEISPDQEDVTLHVTVAFDSSTVGFAFWQYCEPERRRHKRYLFNLTGVSDLRDSGIGWLLMFSKRVRALGAHLTLVNGTPEFEQRCIAAGSPWKPV